MPDPQEQLTIQKKLTDTFGMETSTVSFEQFVEQLASTINDLILQDLNKLVSILYRVDIAEERLALLLRNSGGKDAGRIIAETLIERQLQKIEIRPSGNADTEIPESEKW